MVKDKQNSVEGRHTGTQTDREIHDELRIIGEGLVRKLKKMGFKALKTNSLYYFIFINVRFKVHNVMHLYFS